ncbi:MAG TPA: type IV pilus modification protein PilV [Steroidobacteraceae bacterium]|nr:type IV pilus modification protein PilV [Steroidobacteraceae bacterium]
MNSSSQSRRRRRYTEAPCCARPSQQGFTLVEALIALVILSVGLLGVAKLVVSAVHADDSAYMRGQATQLAYEMLDQVRANKPAALDGGYALAAAYSDCLTVPCTGDMLAQLDLYNWQGRLGQALPTGTGTVAVAADPNGDQIATITVSWDDSQAQWAFGTPSETTPSLMQITLESAL